MTYSTLDYAAAAFASLILIGPLAMAPHYKTHDNQPVGIQAPSNKTTPTATPHMNEPTKSGGVTPSGDMPSAAMPNQNGPAENDPTANDTPSNQPAPSGTTPAGSGP